MPSTAASPNYTCESCSVRDQTICATLNDAELRELDAIATAVSLSSGQPVFQESDRDAYLFNVTTGAVRLSKLLPDGRRQITGFLFPGDLLGLSVSGVYAYSAEALVETSLCRFERRRLTMLAEKHPKLEHRLLALASNELVEAQEHLVILGQKTAAERVATFLLRMAKRIGHNAGDESIINLPMTREDIADFTGLSIETVSRNLSRLREMGVVEIFHGRRVRIARIGALAQLSGDI